MRLGGPVFERCETPEEYALAHVKKGYRAAYCPAGLAVGDAEAINGYRQALARHDIVLAEVGAWCNPLSKDAKTAKEAFDQVVERLALADELGARTCVNIVGSWHPSHWYGPDTANFGEDFFAHAVAVSQKIIDAVKPTRTKMSFEIMPYSFLDSAAEYLRFLKAVDRDAAGIHFDPVNCINSPRLLYDDVNLFKEAFRLFSGETIVSMHLKDLTLHAEPPAVHLEEVPIGTGCVHYRELLKMIDGLPADTPAMLEHLPDEAAFDAAAAAVRGFAAQAGVAL